MLTVFPCFAREDGQVARDLAEFLERDASVRVFLQDGEIGPGETIVSKAADGLQAAVILPILSPDSAPARWVRRDWEPARQMGVDGCGAQMEALRQTLADAPGIAVLTGPAQTVLALEFARQSKRDFEGLVWLSCTGPTLASLAGDMATQLGMTLAGELESNLPELSRFCAQRRLLIALDDAPDEAERLAPRGRSSALLIKRGAGPRPAMPMPAAVHACGNIPFRLALLAETAGLDLSAAAALLEELVSSGAAIQLDTRYPRYVAQAASAEMTLASEHAQAVCRLLCAMG